jgi:hypothetical protein
MDKDILKLAWGWYKWRENKMRNWQTGDKPIRGFDVSVEMWFIEILGDSVEPKERVDA